jgi:hypothetical protein
MHADVEPERVTSFLFDSSVNPPGMTTEAVYETPAVVGNSYEWTFKMLGIPRKGVTVITEYVPGERVASRSFGAWEGTSTWTVEPEDGGSKATVQVEFRLPVPLIDRFFDPILKREWEKGLAWGLRELEKQPKAKKTTA